MPLQDESYECLEFEGDSVLGVCVATYLRHKYPERKQGFLTDARKELVNNERIGQLSRQIGLDRFYVISRHNEESAAIHGRTNLKKLGENLRSLLGCAMDRLRESVSISVYTFVTTVMETYLDIEEAVSATTNYKDVFQKYCQRELRCTPSYVMLSERFQEGRDPRGCLR
jgi:ribonuclease-3